MASSLNTLELEIVAMKDSWFGRSVPAMKRSAARRAWRRVMLTGTRYLSVTRAKVQTMSVRNSSTVVSATAAAFAASASDGLA